MAKTLQLIFNCSNDKAMTISIANPKPNVSDATVNAAMDAIVNSNYFNREGVVIVSKKQARFVDREVTEIPLA